MEQAVPYCFDSHIYIYIIVCATTWALYKWDLNLRRWYGNQLFFVRPIRDLFIYLFIYMYIYIYIYSIKNLSFSVLWAMLRPILGICLLIIIDETGRAMVILLPWYDFPLPDVTFQNRRCAMGMMWLSPAWCDFGTEPLVCIIKCV